MVVINAAGTHGDMVEAINRPSPFEIRPRKGQFVVFDKPGGEAAEGDHSAGADRTHQGHRHLPHRLR